MKPLSAGEFTIGSNSISFEMMGHQETFAYNAATVNYTNPPFASHTQKCMLLIQQHAAIPFSHARTDDAPRATSLAA